LLFCLCTAAALDQNQQGGDNDVSLLVDGLPSRQERDSDLQDLSAVVFIALFCSCFALSYASTRPDTDLDRVIVTNFDCKSLYAATSARLAW
jgi:hypothetical protein